MGVFATVHTGTIIGVEAEGVRVEVRQSRGMPGFDIVGLPETAVRESRVRVMAAIAHSQLAMPERRFVINLAPADVRKSGTSFDLAIAVALLAACGVCAPNRLADTLVFGELSLDGRLRATRGALPQLSGAKRRGLRAAIIPEADGPVASLMAGLDIACAATLTQVVDYLNGVGSLEPPRGAPKTTAAVAEDLADVRGQAAAKRALEVAAAGEHNLLFVGPPGAGKTMLARRLPGVLPPPGSERWLQIASIHSAAGLPMPRAGERPFRAPHHTASEVALIGGADPVRPGEVTLAHGGVLFLDELPEFRRSVIEALRPTMESGVASIARARYRVSMPARPLVVAAMNPCPCGFAGDRTRLCRCSPDQVARYRGRISGPLVDRFDMHVSLPPVRVSELRRSRRGEPTHTVRERVCAARARRDERRARPDGALAEHSLDGLRKQASGDALRLLQHGVMRLGLSLRAYVKVLRLARTIADLAGDDSVGAKHVTEAIQYRVLDRDPRQVAGASQAWQPPSSAPEVTK